MPQEKSKRPKGQIMMDLSEINSMFDGVATQEEMREVIEALIKQIKAIKDELQSNSEMSKSEINSYIAGLRSDVDLFADQMRMLYEDTTESNTEHTTARLDLEARYEALQEKIEAAQERLEMLNQDEWEARAMAKLDQRVAESTKPLTAQQVSDLVNEAKLPITAIKDWDSIEREWSRTISLAATAQIEVLSAGTKIGSSHRLNFGSGATVTMENGTITLDVNGLPDQTGSNGKFLYTDGTAASWVQIVGGGDLLAVNNLSDVADVPTARTNLGLKGAAILDVGTTAGTVAAGDHVHTGVYQPADAELTALAGLTSAANKLPMFSGSGSATVIDFKDEDNMASNSATAVPSQQSTKAYVDTADALLQPKAAIVDASAFTGFKDPDGVQVAYNYTNRTITLTGDLTYYWKGAAKTLSSPWTSSAHDDTEGTWFLYTTDGDTFAWSASVWNFTQVMVAFVKRGASAAASFAVRETHGMMDPESHEELHAVIGTYRASGGGVTAGTYAENTATDAAVTPGFDSAIVKDEDLATTIPAWTQGTYTTMYIGASSVATVDVAASYPFIAAGADNYLQVNNPLTGSMTAGINNRYYNVYQLLVPAAADTDSQKYRTIMIQPQATFTSLSAAQGESINALSLGDFASQEYIIYARITYVTGVGDANYGKCRIATGGISYVVGNKVSQTAITGVSPSAHTSLSNLDWASSGHIGTASSVAGFTSGGVAFDYLVDADLSSVSGSDDTVPSAKATKAALDAKAPIASPTFTGTVTLPIGLTGVIRTDSGVVSVDTDVTDIVAAASTTAAGKVELTIDAEVTTGTSTTLAITPDSLAGSTIFGRKALSVQVYDGGTDAATGDGKAYITIPEALNGMNLVRAQATVVTAGTTNATTVMIHNKTDAADMLSGAISIASGGTVGTVGTVNATYDDVATNDVLRIDVDSVSTTAPKGLMVVLEFQLP